MSLSPGRIGRVLAGGIIRFMGSDGFVYSAAIAFNLLLAAIPVLFLAFAATSMIVGSNDLPFSFLASILKETFPYGAQVLVPNLRKLFASGSTFGLLGTVLLLFTSFSATDAVHTSLGVMLGETRKKRFLRSAGFHVALVLVLTVLVSAAIFVPPMWKGLHYLSKGLSAKWDQAFQILLEGVAGMALALLIFTASVLSYRYLSPRRVSLRNALIGGTGFLFLLYAIKSGFVFYVKKFSRLNLIYGSLFSIICFIIVAYLFAAAYLFCASVIGILEKGEPGDEVHGGD